ncbi:DUF975 family protein [Clostridium sp. NSJ-6]|mgnify:CR=1|uniref:DUF975 family protein n=1 Tax=Clostridium hominis TaxID=2763036 RepID=A0ABR7DDE5_9CLOT|nr:DUF975 family protein [Clostridium hominis]MDU2671279.1 DUF975 family protein [Clostridium sp.]
MERVELKNRAKDQLRGNWGIAIGGVLLAAIFIDLDVIYNIAERFGLERVTLSVPVNLLSIFLGGVISTGLCKLLLNIATKREKPNVENIFSYFDIYLKTLGLNILISIAVIIGSILFIIPGIIVALMFSQAFFILAEDRSKSITECLSESAEMMKGYKWEFFVLELSFIGWWIVSALTLGIGGLWVAPYQKVTEANFYLNLKVSNKKLY